MARRNRSQTRMGRRRRHTPSFSTAAAASVMKGWVLPLAIYLLSFILCFEGEGWYRRNPYLQLLAVALGSMVFAVSVDPVPIKVMIPLFAMGLFTCCMVCHGELARLKPDPKYLTHFYLMMAAGGALGGLLVGLLAPHFLNALYEMPVSLVACAALVS